ncbi:stress responsive A/B barrel domain protein [Akanthomyces lecanii RCEF 1005]|uniref:Stress responsive A/B barrel domain protein n=1 Tax=Akanthomyces lecanii RCEF 1005 TaxID=1081108 RepID=A0A168FMB5_CORDF|nr:stress responsive A/B barrel domain protein [Akanthomyces lecanii RCEF 1005]
MADHVHRVTLFKLPKPDDVDAMIEQYKILEATHQKDGKPYLQSVVVGKPEADPRAQGYTLAAKTEFASAGDMKYYDEECPAHKQLKGVAKTLTMEGVLSVFFKPTITGGISQ